VQRSASAGRCARFHRSIRAASAVRSGRVFRSVQAASAAGIGRILVWVGRLRSHEEGQGTRIAGLRPGDTGGTLARDGRLRLPGWGERDSRAESEAASAAFRRSSNNRRCVPLRRRAVKEGRGHQVSLRRLLCSVRAASIEGDRFGGGQGSEAREEAGRFGDSSTPRDAGWRGLLRWICGAGELPQRRPLRRWPERIERRWSRGSLRWSPKASGHERYRARFGGGGAFGFASSSEVYL
jgi:hypothetical protein